MSKEIPIQIPNPEVEVIAERRKSRRRHRYDEVTSSVDGVQLIMEPGSILDFNKKKIIGLQAGFDRIERGKKAKIQSDLAREKQIEAAEESTYRGVVSERGNYRGTVTPTERNVYDADLLKQSTGEFYDELVREEGRLEVDLPFGSDENGQEELKKFAKAVARLLIRMGRDPEEVSTLIRIGLKHRLDEERLDQLIKTDQVELQAGTRRIETSWTVKTDAIEKSTKPKRQRKLEPKDKT